MPAQNGYTTRPRSAVIWGSLILAVGGWCTAVGLWVILGYEAGVSPGFIMALTMAGTFSITLGHAVVLPDKARLYALGWRDSRHECGCADRAEESHPPALSIVRH